MQLPRAGKPIGSQNCHLKLSLPRCDIKICPEFDATSQGSAMLFWPAWTGTPHVAVDM